MSEHRTKAVLVIRPMEPESTELLCHACEHGEHDTGYTHMAEGVMRCACPCHGGKIAA